MREKTHAHRKMVDDVPENVKQARLAEMIQVFKTNILKSSFITKNYL